MTVTNDDIIITAYNITGKRPTAPRKNQFSDQESYQAALDAFARDSVDYEQSVKSAAREIAVALSAESGIKKQLVALGKAIDKESKDGKVFIGTICSIRTEQTSKRALVTIYTGTDRAIDGVPLGYETVRTERTDNPDGRALAREVQALIGHRATFYIEMESFGSGANQKKSRVLRHVTDGGVDAKFDSASGQVAA
jgi:hypothetical protein